MSMTYGNGVYQHLHTGCFPPTWRCLSPSETQEFSKVANSLGFVLYEPAFYTLYGGYRLPHSNLDLFLGTTRKGVLPGTQKQICAYYAAGRLKMCSTNNFSQQPIVFFSTSYRPGRFLLPATLFYQLMGSSISMLNVHSHFKPLVSQSVTHIPKLMYSVGSDDSI